MTVADFFDVSGDDTNNIIFRNTSTQLDYIGYGMKEGEITIEGDAGDYLGANMQGGVLVCQGNAKERTADKMRRGILLIDGDVGAYCGSRMIAGTVGIYGSTGPHLGYGLRRGTILLNKQANLSATWLDCGMHTLPFLSLLLTAFKPLKSKFSKLNNTRVQRWMGDASQTGKGEILLFQD
jgi:formylmethanofuran dehydrogenase subunit C